MTDLAPVKGKYVTVVPHNRFFHHVVAMCLEHFDTPKRENTVILCDCDFFKPLEYYKQLYKGKKLIIYQEEQLFSPPKNQEGHTWIPIGTIVAFLKKAQDDPMCEIWDYDYNNEYWLKGMGVKVDKVQPMKWTKVLKTLQNKENPEIDVLFYGSPNDRRATIMRDLFRKCGFYANQWSLVNLWGVPLHHVDQYIENSKIILNLHPAHPYHRQEQTRIFYPVINNKCVLTEASIRNYFIDQSTGENALVESSIKYMPYWIKRLLLNEEWKDIANKSSDIYYRICNPVLDYQI